MYLDNNCKILSVEKGSSAEKQGLQANDKIIKIIRVAKKYYESHMDQKVIAQEEGMSVSTVSRMLKKAEEMGYIKITVEYPVLSNEELSASLKKKYNLEKVFLVPKLSDAPVAVQEDVCRAAAKDLSSYLNRMHSEFFSVSPESADLINERRAAGGRVIAVGTTSCRTLESASDENGILHAMSDDTGIFIYPGYKFKITDALITNFHLPESTLLMLVSAFAGRERMLEDYRIAVEAGYRFFSFGDAMLIE